MKKEKSQRVFFWRKKNPKTQRWRNAIWYGGTTGLKDRREKDRLVSQNEKPQEKQDAEMVLFKDSLEKCMWEGSMSLSSETQKKV